MADMSTFDETLIFPVLGGLAVLMFVVAQIFPNSSRLRHYILGAFGVLLVGAILLSVVLYLAN